ncbi:hypothetical protein P3342_001754 [Pyrenophora teres f. teres]|nr:hypothetical protein P3342_001754 [Pyrenophora teres f. teres]
MIPCMRNKLPAAFLYIARLLPAPTGSWPCIGFIITIARTPSQLWYSEGNDVKLWYSGGSISTVQPKSRTATAASPPTPTPMPTPTPTPTTPPMPTGVATTKFEQAHCVL